MLNEVKRKAKPAMASARTPRTIAFGILSPATVDLNRLVQVETSISVYAHRRDQDSHASRGHRRGIRRLIFPMSLSFSWNDEWPPLSVWLPPAEIHPESRRCYPTTSRSHPDASLRTMPSIRIPLVSTIGTSRSCIRREGGRPHGLPLPATTRCAIY